MNFITQNTQNNIQILTTVEVNTEKLCPEVV